MGRKRNGSFVVPDDHQQGRDCLYDFAENLSSSSLSYGLLQCPFDKCIMRIQCGAKKSPSFGAHWKKIFCQLLNR